MHPHRILSLLFLLLLSLALGACASHDARPAPEPMRTPCRALNIFSSIFYRIMTFFRNPLRFWMIYTLH